MRVVPAAISFSIKRASEILPVFQQAQRTITEKQSGPVFSLQFLQDIQGAFAEGAANAISHASEIEKRGTLDCRLSLKKNEIEIRIVDHGPGFNINRVPNPRFRKMSERGRGIFMMRQLMDEVTYRRLKGSNILVMKRHLVASDPEMRDLDLLHEISQAILQGQGLESVYRIILDKMVDLFTATKASILMLDEVTGNLKVMASRGLSEKLSRQLTIRPGEGIAGYVFQHAKPCLIENMDRNIAGWKKKKKYKSRSFISAPMIFAAGVNGPETVGVINLTDRLDGGSYTRKDLRLLTTIANQASAYLHTCRLLSQAREAELIRQELGIAHRIQQNYLPRKAPQFAGLDMAGWCETAQSIGGDYYDFIIPEEGHFYVVIADVSGHSVASALTMANFRSHLKAILLHEREVGRVLTYANRMLYEDLTKNEQFISMVLAHFQKGDLRVEIAMAGHKAPLLLKKREVEYSLSGEKSGMVIGVSSDEIYETNSFLLDVGQGLLFYTDGLTEMVNHEGKRLTEGGLHHLLKSLSTLKPSALVESIKKEVYHFRKGIQLSDDVTLVAVRRGEIS